MESRLPFRVGWWVAIVALAGACADRAPTDTRSAGKLSMDVVAGDAQSATAGTELPDPLVVRVKDANGQVVSDQVVNFRITEGGGSVFAGAALTDAQGIAKEYWTLGPSVGAQTLEVRAVNSDTGERQVFATFRATGLAPVARVSVVPGSATVEVGDAPQFAGLAEDAQGNVQTGRTFTWSSSNTAVATVAANGTVTTLKGGNATITASTEGKSGSADLVVTAPVRSVTVQPSTSTVDVGGTVQLTATLKDRVNNVLTGRTVTWTTSNALVATVDTNGRVMGRVPGTATITATSEGQSGSATVVVGTSLPL